MSATNVIILTFLCATFAAIAWLIVEEVVTLKKDAERKTRLYAEIERIYREGQALLIETLKEEPHERA